ncbi:LuxR family transcriptional regulator [Thermococcus sp.]
MKPLPFLSALLVLVSMTMPWFTAGQAEGIGFHVSSTENSVSLINILQQVYSNPTEFQRELAAVFNSPSSSSIQLLVPIIAVTLVAVGAVVGLFRGRLGHGTGITGMVLLTGFILYTSKTGLSSGLTLGTGYLLAWIGFSVGLISSAS